MTKNIVYNKTELISELKTVYSEVNELVASVSKEQCHTSVNEKWSIAENLEHLILSSFGVASVLKQPKSVFERFGQPKGPSRSYDALYETYKKALAGGIKAPATYSPTEGHRKTRKELVESWQMIVHKFEQRINNFWTEEELEKYALPHPAIGLLTVREMLYATIFHTYHHLEAMQKLR